jgi:hypothetical protein
MALLVASLAGAAHEDGGRWVAGIALGILAVGGLLFLLRRPRPA